LRHLRKRFDECGYFMREAHQPLELPSRVKSQCCALMMQAVEGDFEDRFDEYDSIVDSFPYALDMWKELQGTARLDAMTSYIGKVQFLTSRYGLHLPLSLDPATQKDMERRCPACWGVRRNFTGGQSTFSEFVPDRFPRFIELQMLRDKDKEDKAVLEAMKDPDYKPPPSLTDSENEDDFEQSEEKALLRSKIDDLFNGEKGEFEFSGDEDDHLEQQALGVERLKRLQQQNAEAESYTSKDDDDS